MNDSKNLIITYDTWTATYRPIGEPGCPRQFDWFDNDLEELRAANQACIWTELDNRDIISGFHFVNRVSYYLTEVPCPDSAFITVFDDDFEPDDEDELDEGERLELEERREWFRSNPGTSLPS